MRLIKLPVFTPKALDPVPMFVNLEQVFFIATADVPSTVIDKNEEVISKEGTVISSGAQGALLVDMKLHDVVSLFGLAEPVEVVIREESAEGQKEVKKDEQSKPAKVNTKRVRKSPKVRK